MLAWDKTKRQHRKTTPVVFLFAVTAVILFGFIAQIFYPNLASAAPVAPSKESCEAAGGEWKNIAPTGGVPNMGCSGASVASQQTLDWQIKSLLYYRSLGECFRDDSSNTISKDKVSSGQWFIESDFNDRTAIGPYMRYQVTVADGDSATACYGDEGKKLVTQALSHWGLESVEFLCNIGFSWKSVPNDSRRCDTIAPDEDDSMAFGWNSDGTAAKKVNEATSKALSYLRSTFYGGATPELDRAGWYLFYRTVFFNKCDTTQKSGDGNATRPGTLNDRDVSFYDVDASGKVQQRWYRLDSNMVNNNFTTRIGDAMEFSDVKRTCEAIAANHLNEANAKIYGLLVEEQPDLAVPPPTQAEGGGTNNATSTCVIEGIGWIICPVTNFLAGIADASFSVISNFLIVDVSLFDTSSGTYSAWSAFRNIANVAFVIVFLFIIFSQLTGQGVTNYGIKKTLPRLVIAAILVNISYFVCQFAIDATQILGVGIREILKNVPIGSGGTGGALNWTDVMSGVLMGVVIGLGAAAGVAILALSISLPVLLAVILAVLMTIIILIGRQAGIVILTVLAPLAFVAFMLPNTEQWFKRWYKMFFALLMVFPIVALLYGGGELASKIISSAANSGDTAPDMRFWLGLTALAVAALPLIMTPSLLKGAMKGTGEIGAKLSSMASKTNSRVGVAANTQSRYGEAKQGLRNRFALSRATRRAHSKAQLKLDNSRLGRAIGLDKGSSRALRIVDEEFEKEVKDAGTSQSTLSLTQVQAIATSGTNEEGKKVSTAARAAAIDRVMSTGGFNDRRAVLEAMASNKDTTTEELRGRAVSAAYAKGDSNIYGTKFGDRIIQKASNGGSINGGEDLAKEALTNAAAGSLSAEHLVQGEGSARYLIESAISHKATAALTNMRAAAETAKSTASTIPKVTTAINAEFAKIGVTPNSPIGQQAGAGPDINNQQSRQQTAPNTEGTVQFSVNSEGDIDINRNDNPPSGGSDAPPSTPPTPPAAP